jgi:uncharacterized damage-inducible protein DinB
MRLPVIATLLTLVTAFPLAAQQYIPKDLLVADFERQRAVLMKYVDAMPDSGLGFMPTPQVRSYAQQLEHIAQSTAGITGEATRAGKPPVGDPVVYLRNKSALKDFINRSFDFAIAAAQNLTAAAMVEEVDIFNMGKRPRWKWILGVQEHTAWTLGQTVPYLRLNGVTPPSYLPF